MIITTRFAIFLAFGAIPLAVSGLVPAAAFLGFIYIGIVLVIGLFDWFMTPNASSVEIERLNENKLSLGAENAITIKVRNRTKLPLSLVIRDEPPYLFTINGNVMSLELGPKAQREITYHVNPHSRGDFSFGDIFIRFKGPLRMLVRQCRIPATKPIKVYPNLLDVRKYELLLRKGRTLETGIRRIRLYGKGTEFESLREYSPDDEYRQVDWKASARRGRMMSRQYQVERSQNIVILLDAGRTMSLQLENMTKLDHAVNAAQMLAYVASSGDDKVGLLTFSDKIHTFLPPSKGRTQGLAIMEALYNVPITTQESDYAKAFLHLARRWRKRSLVVVFSDLLDPESSRQIIMNLQTLASTHLCMCVAISDSNVLAAAKAIPEESTELYEKAAAVQLLHDREQAILALQRTGVIVVDSEPGTLSLAVINQYLQAKSRLRL